MIVAEYEVDRSRESWMETHDHRRNRGVTHDGQLRFGYGKCRRPLEGDPDSRCEKCRVGALHVEESEAAYVREMFERLSAGEPMNRIVVDMTARGLRTREGAVLSHDSGSLSIYVASDAHSSAMVCGAELIPCRYRRGRTSRRY
ncbi:recombinase family protein [Streptomyces sp. NBC_00846]|uniref:hypothetical protein n=1 Tax=Streptomyces sp. NBC_00846 TaxID=2975849 RepID=UPI003868044B|nr:recombinase family protein [Streptomyces sp. NBC_00846]